MTDAYLPALHVLKIIAVVSCFWLSLEVVFTQKELVSLTEIVGDQGDQKLDRTKKFQKVQR